MTPFSDIFIYFLYTSTQYTDVYSMLPRGNKVILGPSGQGCQYGTAILLFGQAGWKKIAALDPRRPIIKAQVNLGAV